MEEQKTTDQRSPDITFRPLTEGLGFHPFSDGLPYAPITKKPYTGSQNTTPGAGLGAVSAGPPQLAHSVPQPRFAPSVPLNLKSSKASGPVIEAKAEALNLTGKKISLQDSLRSSIEDWVPGYAYLIKRVAAYLFDSTLNSLIFGIIAVEFIWKQDASLDILTHSSVILAASLLMFFWNWILIAIQETLFGVTVGKYIFGLSLRGSGVILFLRSFFFIPSISFLGVGLLFSLFDRRKRCWHDRVVGVQPLETPKV